VYSACTFIPQGDIEKSGLQPKNEFDTPDLNKKEKKRLFCAIIQRCGVGKLCTSTQAYLSTADTPLSILSPRSRNRH